MFTQTDTINGESYELSASVTANGQRCLTQITFNAVSGAFRVSKTFFIRDIETKDETYADFKKLVRESRREYDKAIAFVERKGFSELVVVPPSE